MRDSRPRLASMVYVLFFLAIASLASVPALAASSAITSAHIVVQPITVCAQNCTGCAPVNDKGQTSSPAYITFLDPATGGNVTEEILSHDLGIRVTWLALRQYCSPLNTFSIPSYGTTFQTLHMTQDSSGNISSPDFMTLAQQPYIANNFVVPNPTNPPGGNTACTVDVTNGNLQAPCVPVSNVPTTISMFFVDKLMPTNFTGVPYGYGMINGVNLAIKAGHLDSTGKPAAGSGIFNPGGLTPPQIDVPAHEIAHNFALAHLSSPASDLEAPGGTRKVSSLSTFNANLVAGNVDQLNATQQALVLDPTGLLNPVQHATTTVVTDQREGFSGFFDFTTTLPGDSTSTASLTRTVFVFNKAFSPSRFVVISSPPGVTVTGSQFNGNLGNGIVCGSGSIKCFDIEIRPGLASGATVKFALKLGSSIDLDDLEDSKFTYFFSDQFVTTSDVVPSGFFGDNNDDITLLTADSLIPDLTTPAILAVPSAFVGSGNPCTVNLEDGSCPSIGIYD
jgi:hypothetical protein